MSDMRNVNGPTRRDVSGRPPGRDMLRPVDVATDAGGSSSRAGPGTARRLLGGSLPSNRRRLGNGQGQTTKLAAAGHTNAPCELCLVSRALVANLETLRAVGPSAITLDVALGAGEAIISSTAGRGTSSALAGSSGVLYLDGLLRSGSCHVGGSKVEMGIFEEMQRIEQTLS